MKDKKLIDLKVGSIMYYVNVEKLRECEVTMISTTSIKNRDTYREVKLTEEAMRESTSFEDGHKRYYANKSEALIEQREKRSRALKAAKLKVTNALKAYDELLERYTCVSDEKYNL